MAKVSLTETVAGGAGGYIGSSLSGAQASTQVGASIGAGIGSIAGPIGTLVGGMIGSVAGSMFSHGKKDVRYVSRPTGGDTYYKDYASASYGADPWAWHGKKVGNKIQFWLDNWSYLQDRDRQNAEFNALANRTKTVNYGSSISNGVMSGEAGDELQREKATLALNDEENRLNGLGNTQLIGGL